MKSEGRNRNGCWILTKNIFLLPPSTILKCYSNTNILFQNLLAMVQSLTSDHIEYGIQFYLNMFKLLIRLKYYDKECKECYERSKKKIEIKYKIMIKIIENGKWQNIKNIFCCMKKRTAQAQNSRHFHTTCCMKKRGCLGPNITSVKVAFHRTTKLETWKKTSSFFAPTKRHLTPHFTSTTFKPYSLCVWTEKNNLVVQCKLRIVTLEFLELIVLPNNP